MGTSETDVVDGDTDDAAGKDNRFFSSIPGSFCSAAVCLLDVLVFPLFLVAPCFGDN